MPCANVHKSALVIKVIIHLFLGGEDIFVGVGDNTILQCDEAKHQAVASVEWFCRCETFWNYSLQQIFL